MITSEITIIICDHCQNNCEEIVESACEKENNNKIMLAIMIQYTKLVSQPALSNDH